MRLRHGAAKGYVRCLPLVAALIGALLALSAAGAGATELSLFTTFGESEYEYGGVHNYDAAGQTFVPRGVAVDPVTHDIYVADQSNRRVDEFGPWGEFVMAFGWDVAPGAVNEQQEVRVRASAGQYRLTFGSGGPGVSETGDLPFDATGAEVQAALNGLSNVSGGGGSVSVDERFGEADGSMPWVYVITFHGSLAATNVPELGTATGSTPLAGGQPSSELTVRTRANGSEAGAGLQDCTTESGCQEGASGIAPGQIDTAYGIGSDGAGDLYVTDVENHRVEKYTPAGEFLLMFGGQVNKTAVEESRSSEENVCPAEGHPSDVCQAGSEGTGPGEFGEWWAGADEAAPLAVAPDGDVYVGDTNRVERFTPNGTFESQLSIAEGLPKALALDDAGHLYLSYAQPTIYRVTQPNIFELDSTTGQVLSTLEAQEPTALATDAAGDVYAFDAKPAEHGKRVAGIFTEQWALEFDAAGALLTEFDFVVWPGGERSYGIATGPVAAGGEPDVYVGMSVGNGRSYVNVFGPAPDRGVVGPPPLVAPAVVGQYASNVGVTDATLKAEIDPHFWPDTNFYVEYGTGRCSEGGCEGRAAFPAMTLSARVTGEPVTSVGVPLAGLEPGRIYHFRFVAQSRAGGPVYGVEDGGPASFAAGGEGSFRTYAVPVASAADCPNAGLRVGASAELPDCRAFEMVSPVDKEGGDIRSLYSGSQSQPASIDQAAAGGGRFTYSSYRAFGDSRSAPYASQYMAVRGADGWGTEAMSPFQEGRDELELGALDTSYKGFSEDLCSGWILQGTEPLLAPEAVSGYANLYQREDCAGGGFTALSRGTPTGVNHGVNNQPFIPALQGFSADGSRAVFDARGKLVSEASTNPQLYDYDQGKLRLVCYQPNGAPYAGRCQAGTSADDTTFNFNYDVYRAMSADGSRVYWSDANGRLYVRVHPELPQSPTSAGQCTDPADACTLAVSAGPALFWSGSATGNHAIYTEGSELYEATLSEEAGRFVESSHLIAAGISVEGVMGASEDGTMVYFASPEVLTEEPNQAGVKAQAGESNLYLYRSAGGGSYTFIGTVASSEFAGSGPGGMSAFKARPVERASRVSADGLRAVFVSRARLTGYDNTDQVTGEADFEVFVYEAGGEGGPGHLRCISCNPSGARPRGTEVKYGEHGVMASGAIPAWTNEFYPSRVLSSDGSRVFFESYEPLVPRDTDGVKDVYEWEAAHSAGECQALGAEVFLAGEGGCLSLISSGESPAGASLLDASADGSNVFFTTGASLLPRDPGLVDVYDARVDGGFTEPVPAPQCEGEACQAPVSPPVFATPGSSTFEGAGNLTRHAARRRCAAGRRRVQRHGRSRCIKRQSARTKKTRRGKHRVRHRRGRAGHHRRGHRAAHKRRHRRGRGARDARHRAGARARHVQRGGQTHSAPHAHRSVRVSQSNSQRRPGR